ncbi:hypothetical protein IMSAGC005_02312 [Lachnospiraceae bacterium]|nr:hypothetical protein IMSAGC005_02312 [Lachnospiraceae bacterium]
MSMKLREIIISSIVIFAVSACQRKEAIPNTLQGEALPDIANQEYDSTADMTSEEVWEYLENYYIDQSTHYKSTVWSTYEELVNYYFPDMERWGTYIFEKREEDYVALVYDCAMDHSERYQAQILIHPDFSVEMLENTIKTNPEAGFCIYASGEDYIYHGCRIAEYHVEAYDEETELYLDATVPLFSQREGADWDELNQCIWQRIKNWFSEEAHYEKGKITLDYEIKTLNNDIYSILLHGIYDNGEWQKNMAIGLTMSMSNGQMLPKTVFATDEEQGSLYDFYMDNNTLYAIKDGKDGSELAEERKIEFHGYSMKKKEGNLYSSNGLWIADVYYELPEILEYSEEVTAINALMRKDMGRFFNELAQEAGECVKNQFDEVEYRSEHDVEALFGEPGYYCYVDTEILYNNEGRFGVIYHYKINMMVTGEGEAIAVYDLNEGEILEYQDWQKEILEKIEKYKQELQADE